MKIVPYLVGVLVALFCVFVGFFLAQDKEPKSLVSIHAPPAPKIEQTEIPVLHEPLLPVVVYTPWPRPTQMDVTTNKEAAHWLPHFPSCNLRGFILARRQNGESIAVVSEELLIGWLQPELFKRLKWEKHNGGATAVAVLHANPVGSYGLPLVGELQEGKSVKVISSFFTITSEPTVATWTGMAKPTRFPHGYSFEADTRSAIQLSSKLVGTGVYDGDKVVGIITKSAAAIQPGAMMSPVVIEVWPIP
jgi:hypothetical protein